MTRSFTNKSMDAFLNNLAQAINQPGLELSPDQKLVDLPTWDSLAILTTLSMLDQEYGVLLSGPEIQNCRTVRDLHEEIEKRRTSCA